MPKYPLTENDFAFKGEEFACAQCGKLTSIKTYFAINASGNVDKGKTGGGRLYEGADLAELSLWHVTGGAMHQIQRLRLSVGRFNGGNANVFFCSADCLKSYLIASVDELVKRSEQEKSN